MYLNIQHGSLRRRLCRSSNVGKKCLIGSNCNSFGFQEACLDLPAFTTNVEFGYWLHSGKVIYGRPDNASKIKYLDWLYKLDYKENPFNNLRELLNGSISKCDDLFK